VRHLARPLVLVLLFPVFAQGAVDTLKPNGNGATANWTLSGCSNAWECLDEDASDSLTTDLQATTDGTTHQITFEDPAFGDISVCSVIVHFGYTTGPSRQVEWSYDTGAGYVLIANHDLGNEWVQDTMVFTSPDSLHIANLEIQFVLIEPTKIGNQMHWSWAEVRYWYTPPPGGATPQVIIIGMTPEGPTKYHMNDAWSDR